MRPIAEVSIFGVCFSWDSKWRESGGNFFGFWSDDIHFDSDHARPERYNYLFIGPLCIDWRIKWKK